MGAANLSKSPQGAIKKAASEWKIQIKTRARQKPPSKTKK